MLRHALAIGQSKQRQRVCHHGTLTTLEDLFRNISIPNSRCFSSGQVQESNTSNEEKEPPQRQPFVTVRLEPGEWDRDRKDPLYRPKFRSTSKLISAEDFANRPPVSFGDEFETYEDAMITLSWLDQKTCRQIYNIYVDMMVLSHRKHERTSHEYVTKVIAQKFNITPWRAAAVIQLQHNEEQMRKNNPELLQEEHADYAEQKILQNISDAYKSQRSEPPRSFVEDPAGKHGRGDPDETSSRWKRTEDLFDVDQKIEDANIRDAKRARLLIDSHIYVEDVDDNAVDVQVDANCRRLVKSKKRLEEELSKVEEEGQSQSIPYPETNTEGEKRPRWKYVAKVVDTRLLKKKGKKYKTYTNNNTTNTLVEQNGKLRVATVEEAKHVEWKRERNGLEFIYRGAKKAWIDKTIHGKTDVWGAPPITKAPQPQKHEASPASQDEKEGKGNNADAKKED